LQTLWASDKSQDIIEDAINIDTLLSEYNYESAYPLMQAFITTYKDQSKTSTYLKVLASMVALEYHYWMYDKLLEHADLLYNLSDAPEHWRFRIDALEVFAYYDYFNYENYKAVAKYNEMQAYATSIDSENILPQYYYGMALLAIDDQKYSEALELVDKGLALSEKPFAKSHIYAPQTLSGLKFKAEIAHFQKDYVTSVKRMQEAYNTISPKDIDRLAAIGFDLTQYHIDANDIKSAEQMLSTATANFERSKALLKAQIEPELISRLDAQIAYKKGDFRRAAELYSQIAEWKTNPDDVQKTIAANEAASAFELAEIDKQISLLDQLQVEQRERIRLQQRNLVTAYSGIGILIITIFATLFAIRFQIGQRNKLYRLSITDQLTQLYNRAKIIDEFEKLQPGQYCIALIDLDRFKMINDTYGHQAGDHVLKVVADVMQKSIRPNDMIGRYGGEEFLALFQTNSLQTAKDIAERIRQNVEVLEWSYPGLRTTLSIGLVYSLQHMGDLLLNEADSLLYLAKSEGRNQVQAQDVP